MNFVSAIRQLRNSKCAKTPAMRGYVKREDYDKGVSPYASGSALFPAFAADHSGGYAAGDYVWHDGDAWKFVTSHSQGAAWNSAEASKVSAVYDLAFVENAGYATADSAGSGVYQDNSAQYAFRAVVTSDGTAWVSGPSSPLAIDTWLWTLMLRDDWETFDLGQVQASSESTKRW